MKDGFVFYENKISLILLSLYLLVSFPPTCVSMKDGMRRAKIPLRPTFYLPMAGEIDYFEGGLVNPGDKFDLIPTSEYSHDGSNQDIPLREVVSLLNSEEMLPSLTEPEASNEATSRNRPKMVLAARVPRPIIHPHQVPIESYSINGPLKSVPIIAEKPKFLAGSLGKLPPPIWTTAKMPTTTVATTTSNYNDDLPEPLFEIIPLYGVPEPDLALMSGDNEVPKP